MPSSEGDSRKADKHFLHSSFEVVTRGEEPDWARVVSRHYVADQQERLDGTPLEVRLQASNEGFLAWQDLLLHRVCDPLTDNERHSLGVVVLAVRMAMKDSLADPSPGGIKRHELELLGDRPPLTFCWGTVKQISENLAYPIPGCGRVFKDTRRAGGGRRAYWKRWCDECATPTPLNRLVPQHVRNPRSR